METLRGVESGRFKENYKSREGFNNIVRRMRDSYYNYMGIKQYAKKWSGSSGDDNVCNRNSRGNESEQSERSGGADTGKGIVDNAEQKSRVIYTIG